jgi:RND family efflux transporter MFP subunit
MLLAGCGPAGDANSSGSRILPVAVTPLERQDRLSIERRYTGLVAERSGVRLGFEVPGTLEDLRADIGESVEAGQVLARLDTRRLEAGLATARAGLDEARAAAALAASTLRRVRQAYDRDALSVQDREEAESRLQQAEATVNRLEQEVAGLEVDLDKATLKAPFPGRIQDRYRDTGAVVSPGVPVFRLLGASGREIRIGVAAAVADKLRPGAGLTVRDARSFRATIREIAPGVDRHNRMVTLVADPATDAPVLRPGQQVAVSLTVEHEASGYWLPRSALSEDLRGLWAVYRVAPDEAGEGTVVRQVPVEVIHFESERAFVRGALTGEDRIVADGIHRLVPGQRVKPVADPEG